MAQTQPGVVAEPICFGMSNEAPWQVHGIVMTDYYTTPDGIRARHRSQFKMKPGEAQKFCTTGPFYPGNKLELTLRTLLPVFSCQTRIDKGMIIIKGERDKDGVAQTWAECFE